MIRRKGRAANLGSILGILRSELRTIRQVRVNAREIVSEGQPAPALGEDIHSNVVLKVSVADVQLETEGNTVATGVDDCM